MLVLSLTSATRIAEERVAREMQAAQVSSDDRTPMEPPSADAPVAERLAWLLAQEELD